VLRITPTAAVLAGLLAVPSLALGASHPRVLFTEGDVPTLRAQAQTSHQAIRGSLQQGADEFVGTRVARDGTVTWPAGRTFTFGDKRDVGYSLVVWSFTWQITGAPQYLDLARGWLLDVASWPTWDLDGAHDLVQSHLLYGAAFAYDLLWPVLTEPERAAVRDAIVREASGLLTAAQGGIWWSSEYLQNHNWVNTAALGYAALAVEGEASAAATDAWLAHATGNARRVKAVCDALADGTWHEGLSYLSYGFIWHLPFVDALKRSGREDLTDLQLLRGLGTLRAHVQIPEKPNSFFLPFGDFIGWNVDDQLAPLRYAASRYGSGLAQLAADRWVAGTPRYTFGPESARQVFEFLFYDPNVLAADLAQEPLDWYGRDLQAVAFRSGWGEGSLLFAMKAGPFGGKTAVERMGAGVPEFRSINFSHDHADDMGFYLHGNGAWLAPEAGGYYIGHADSPGPQANRTEFHNALLVDGAGQLGEGVRPSGDGSIAYAWFRDRQGGIPFQASTAHHAYALAEGARLYPPAAGLTRLERHVLFLDRRWVVLRDVVASHAPRDFDWVVHVMDAATREGSWVKGAAKDGQVLGVAVVSPASFTMTTADQAPPKVTGLDPDGAVTKVAVRPAERAAAAEFLTALVPATLAGWATRPEVSALDAAQPSAGLRIAEGARHSRAIFADAPGATRNAGGLALDGLAGAVATQDGTPVRALVVQGRSIADGGRVLLSSAGTGDALEADGLAAADVFLTGRAEGPITVWAPSAARVHLNGAEVPFARSGEHAVVGGAVAVAPTGELADPATAPSAPVFGGGASVDPAPSAPVVAAAPADAAAPRIGPSESPLTVAEPQRGGCSGAGGTSAVALVSLLALVARLVRRGARRTHRAPEPEPDAPPARRDEAA
jgi:hypothetical protein